MARVTLEPDGVPSVTSQMVVSSSTPGAVSPTHAVRVPFRLPLLFNRLVQLVIVLWSILTALFFLLRITGNPAYVLAGQNASPQQLAAVRRLYSLNGSLLTQYGRFIWHAAHFQFGPSTQTQTSAMSVVLTHLPATLLLTGLAMAVTLVVSIVLGAFLGSKPNAWSGTAAKTSVMVAQGIPSFVVALLLIEIFTVQLHWLPSIGHATWPTWIMPSLALAAYLVPQLSRVVAVNISENMGEDYIRTARSYGAGPLRVLLRHALPNSLVAATALFGTQFAYLLSGSLVIESVFSWNGLGQLLVTSVRALDFPVIEAAVFVETILVFMVNACADTLFVTLDPRLRRQQ